MDLSSASLAASSSRLPRFQNTTTSSSSLPTSFPTPPRPTPVSTTPWPTLVPTSLLPDTTHAGKNMPQVCQWTLIAGDSNNRNSVNRWIELEEEKKQRTILQAVWTRKNDSGNNKKSGDCKRWWADQEFVLLSSPNNNNNNNNSTETKEDPAAAFCHIVTSRFLTHQHEVERLAANITNSTSSFCPGWELSNPLPDVYRRPPMPDTLWLSHGFWRLPNRGNHTRNLTCSTRFAPVVKALVKWKPVVPSVTWQTLFPIQAHPTITNAYIDWDYQCQMETARKYGLGNDTVEDVYSYVQPRVAQEVERGSFHFPEPSTLLLKRYLRKCCGGWGSYFSSRPAVQKYQSLDNNSTSF